MIIKSFFPLKANLAVQTNPPLTTPSAKCGSGWRERPFSDFCYHFSDRVETFEKSQASCILMGGNLVSIMDAVEQLFLQNLIEYNVNVKNFWIGANVESPSKGWKWIDGSPFVFINWITGGFQSGPNQFCALITENGEWRTVECNNDLLIQRYNYICKKQVSNQIATTTAVKPLSTKPGYDYNCPPGWSYFYKTNKCYFYVGINKAETYDNAKTICASNSSNLVEINSEDENQFLISLLQSYKNKDNKIIRSRNDEIKKLSCSDYGKRNSTSCVPREKCNRNIGTIVDAECPSVADSFDNACCQINTNLGKIKLIDRTTKQI